MEAVKGYWKNPIFLIGIFFCGTGTLGAITDAPKMGVISELIGFAILVLSIYLIGKEENTHHY